MRPHKAGLLWVLSVCRWGFFLPQCLSFWLTKRSVEEGRTSNSFSSINTSYLPLSLLIHTFAKLGLLCGRAPRHTDLSRMWPHKRAQSECNELSAHYTDLSAFDMSSGSPRIDSQAVKEGKKQMGRRAGEKKKTYHFPNCALVFQKQAVIIKDLH